METIDRQCEKFTGGPAVGYAHRVHVTINPGGTIHINRKTHSMMGKPQAVYLYFNRVKDMIILEPTQAVSANDAFPLLEYRGSYGGRTIRASTFCRHFGIRPDGLLKFVDPEIDSAGRMYLKFSRTVIVSDPSRKRKRLG